MTRRRLIWLLLAVIALGAAAVLTVWRPSRSEGDAALIPLPVPNAPAALTRVTDADYAQFVGSERCAECHANEYDTWRRSTHAAAGTVTPGSPGRARVIAPFNNTPFRFADAEVVPSAEGGRFTFTVRQSGMEPVVIRVDGVIGGGHMEGGGTQGFVMRHEDGTYRFIPFDYSRHTATWFCNTIGRAGKGWVPITPTLSITACADWPVTRVLGDEARFNNCQSCHGSQITVALDTAARSYRTRFTSLDINCESCHGPARRHVQIVRGEIPRGDAGIDIGMASLATMGKDQSLGVCWQCHALKDQLAPGFISGRSLEEYYSLRLPQLGDEPHFPDGRIRTFAYQKGHLYSDCYINGGLTCTNCHDPHSQGYRDVTGTPLVGRFDNRQCTSCHASKVANATQHTRHAPESEGSRCTSCHMPYLQEPELGGAVRYARSDHAIPVPRPTADAALGVMSACRSCHRTKSESELDRQVTEWYGKLKPQALAVDALIEAHELTDRGEVAERILVPTERHTAALFASMSYFLDRFLEPRMADLERDIVGRLEQLAAHDDIDVRAMALASLHYTSGQRNAVRRVLARALTDADSAGEGRLLRSRWSVILGYLADKARARGDAEGAIAIYTQAQEVDPTNARIYLNTGLAYTDAGKPAEGIAAFERSLKLDPLQPLTLVNLGIAFASTGRVADAEGAYRRALALNANEPLAHFNLANLMLQRGDIGAAADGYSRVTELDPSLSYAHFYRARIQVQRREFREALGSVERGLVFDPLNAEGLQLRDQLRAALASNGTAGRGN